MQFANINIDALKRATDFVVGADGTAVVANTYHMIAAAMQAAYNEGFVEGRAEAEQDVEERLDNAFDEGFEQGAAFQELEDEFDTEITAKECWEDGFLEAVEESQRNPIEADRRAQVIIAERAADYFEALEEALAEPEDAIDDERLYDEA
ncbi:hypothetical protein [Bradyrhizobium lupini]|uniref:hypothetical protein n=1 Tax=Rhizobium lupini TaxID=136996 RepID=UPI0034C5FAC8